MPISNYCSDCGDQYSQGAAFCSSCGTARFTPPTVDQRNNQGGTNMHAGRDILLGDQDRWDTRTRAVMDRDRKRPVWPVDWVSVISAIITIASFLGIGPLPGLAIPLGIVGLASGAIAYFTFIAGNDLRTHGSHVLPLGLGTLEPAKDGSTWLTEPVADCPWCPEHNPGTMHVTRTPNGPQWICSSTPNHQDGFDGTQMPPLLGADTRAA